MKYLGDLLHSHLLSLLFCDQFSLIPISAGRDEEVFRLKTGERGGIQNRGLSTAEYKGFEMADEGKKVGKVDRTFCGPL